MNGKQKTMPHGNVPVAGIEDKRTREVVMRLNENVIALEAALKDALAEIAKLKKKEGA